MSNDHGNGGISTAIKKLREWIADESEPTMSFNLLQDLETVLGIAEESIELMKEGDAFKPLIESILTSDNFINRLVDRMAKSGYPPLVINIATKSKIPTFADQAVQHRNTETLAGVEFLWIPTGKFLMGSSGHHANEQPIHRVQITSPFWLGKYPVTNSQYAKFMAATGHREPQHWNDQKTNHPQQPVVGVSWDDAQSFCRWLGDGYRLPTEAAWEYACRAGTTTAYSFGDDLSKLGDHVWFSGNSGGQSQPVGSYPANIWGLCDMHGNAWEWCADWYGVDYYSKSPPADPTGPKFGNRRVLRGGSWGNLADNCRSACRDHVQPDNRDSFIGFRVAKTQL